MKRKNFLINFLSSIDNNEEIFKDTRELLSISDNTNDKDLLNDFFKDYANYFQKKVEEKFGNSILFFKTELQLIEVQS